MKYSDLKDSPYFTKADISDADGFEMYYSNQTDSTIIIDDDGDKIDSVSLCEGYVNITGGENGEYCRTFDHNDKNEFIVQVYTLTKVL